MYRELTKSESAARGLPSKSPWPPYEELVWAEETPDIDSMQADFRVVEDLLGTKRAA